MKKLVTGTIVAGTAAFSAVGLFFAACGSTPPVGSGGTQGGSGAGGVTISTIPIGTAGAGGSGSAGPAPTGDANCGTYTGGTTREPADVLLVLDRSGSMDWSTAADNQNCSGSSTSCTTRWTALTAAVNATLSSTAGSINWGLKLFSSLNGGNCAVNNGVEVAIGASSASSIQAQISKATPGGYTPTATAITAAKTYLDTVTDQNNKVILLATDGEPNCQGGKENTTDDMQGALDAITAAYTAGYKVYVIGIGPQQALANLDKFAAAGGTTNYYPASSPQALTDAFAAISVAVTTCTFTLLKAPPDQNNIAVYLDNHLVAQDPANGWSLGANAQTIVLNGSSCDQITSGAASQVQVLFGCSSPPQILF